MVTLFSSKDVNIIVSLTFQYPPIKSRMFILRQLSITSHEIFLQLQKRVVVILSLDRAVVIVTAHVETAETHTDLVGARQTSA